MKRSDINRIILESIEIIESNGYKLPPFVLWSPKEWEARGHEYDEIRENGLGWDITDFGSGDFERVGLTLITVRNGNLSKADNIKTYAEKIMVQKEHQVTPLHFHWNKAEDIVNRGGGEMKIRLYHSTEDEKLDETSAVIVHIDGCTRTVPAGTVLTLLPGESITIPSRLYHSFWAESGPVMIGEVSKVNDDYADNRFLTPSQRFSNIIEDENPVHLLCNEYPAAR